MSFGKGLKTFSSFYKLTRIPVILKLHKQLTSINSYDTLTENKFLEWSNLKEAADRQLNMNQKWNIYHKENNLENEGKAGHLDFLFFFPSLF